MNALGRRILSGKDRWGRQVTGWIGSMRLSDLVKEISQACGRSATVRRRRGVYGGKERAMRTFGMFVLKTKN